VDGDSTKSNFALVTNQGPSNANQIKRSFLISTMTSTSAMSAFATVTANNGETSTNTAMYDRRELRIRLVFGVAPVETRLSGAPQG
jgi:predicted nucleotide-binding protein (sugar kinase/HSP70/actin superfamily)